MKLYDRVLLKATQAKRRLWRVLIFYEPDTNDYMVWGIFHGAGPSLGTRCRLIEHAEALAREWKERFPNGSTPVRVTYILPESCTEVAV